jgi:hypothetical protein
MNEKTTTLTEITALLPKLPRHELQYVYSLTAQMLGASTEQVETSVTATDKASVEEFYSVMREWHGHKYMDKPPALGILRSRSSKAHAAVLKACTWYRLWAVEALAKRPNKRERIALLYLGLDRLGEFLTKLDVPISVTTLCNNVEKMPSLIDQEFPGYIRNGMLSLVIARTLVAQSTRNDTNLELDE